MALPRSGLLGQLQKKLALHGAATQLGELGGAQGREGAQGCVVVRSRVQGAQALQQRDTPTCMHLGVLVAARAHLRAHIGEETARQLQHLHRIASVVDPDRLTRASEKTAKRSGANLTVFTTEDEALAWLTA